MRTVAIVQARMGSSRLPGKIMADLAGEPMLVRVVNRTRRSQMLDDVVIATTDLPEDDVTADLASSRGWHFYRGSQNDVLDRYYRAAKEYEVDTIVRITSDCPLIDPGLIDGVLRTFFSPPSVEYISTSLPSRTWPRGLDTEAFSCELLKTLWNTDNDPQSREHVTQYVHKHPELFITRGYANQENYSHLRWTVDVQEDLELVRKIYEYFRHDEFTWSDVLQLTSHHPEWQLINAHVRQKAT